jgi:hypothetical protein
MKTDDLSRLASGPLVAVKKKRLAFVRVSLGSGDLTGPAHERRTGPTRRRVSAR